MWAAGNVAYLNHILEYTEGLVGLLFLPDNGASIPFAKSLLAGMARLDWASGSHINFICPGYAAINETMGRKLPDGYIFEGPARIIQETIKYGRPSKEEWHYSTRMYHEFLEDMKKYSTWSTTYCGGSVLLVLEQKNKKLQYDHVLEIDFDVGQDCGVVSSRNPFSIVYQIINAIEVAQSNGESDIVDMSKGLRKRDINKDFLPALAKDGMGILTNVFFRCLKGFTLNDWSMGMADKSITFENVEDWYKKHRFLTLKNYSLDNGAAT